MGAHFAFGIVFFASVAWAQHVEESAPAPKPAPVPSCRAKFAELDPNAWYQVEVGDVRVVNLVAKNERDKLSRPVTRESMGKFPICVGAALGAPCVKTVAADLFVSGTFGEGGAAVMGTTLRQARREVDYVYYPGPKAKVMGRGGIAWMQDGSFAFCMPGQPPAPIDKKLLDERCRGGSKSPVTQFLGGGAMFIKDGRKACSWDGLKKRDTVGGDCDPTIDLTKAQQFAHSFDGEMGYGLESGEMRAEAQPILASRKGRLYFLVAKEKHHKNIRTIQRELCASGFDNALKLDGSSAFGAIGRIGQETVQLGHTDYATSGLLIRAK